MAQPNSESWQTDDLSSEDENFPVHQDEEPFEMFGSGSDEEFSLQTPEQKIATKKSASQDDISETYLNSGKGSSDISTKEGFEAMSSSFSSSSSDGESGTYRLPAGVLQPKMIEIEADSFDMKENLHKPKGGDAAAMLKEKDALYEKLLEKVANYEAELKFTKNKLQAFHDENAKLKYENLTLVEELGGTIEKLQISEENKKEMEIKFSKEIQEGQANFQAKIDLADNSIHLLQAELTSERTRGRDYSREVDELKVALHDTQTDYYKDKSQYQSDITILHDENDALKTRLNEAEIIHKRLEEHIKQYEAKEATFLNDIKQFNMEVSQKNQLVDSLNKSLDSSNLMYDMLKSEKDELFSKLQTLQAEVHSRDINIQQLQEHINKLSMEHKDLTARSHKSQKLAEELALKVMDQEKELEKRRVSVCERADEKREAIRQLCYSIEYYRAEYRELRQALLKYKRPAALAS